MSFKRFFKTVIAMWQVRKECFVCSSFGDVRLLYGVVGYRTEFDCQERSVDYMRGYMRGVEAALLDCGIPMSFVAKNQSVLFDMQDFNSCYEYDNAL